jgi:hypothetical protein
VHDRSGALVEENVAEMAVSDDGHDRE